MSMSVRRFVLRQHSQSRLNHHHHPFSSFQQFSTNHEGPSDSLVYCCWPNTLREKQLLVPKMMSQSKNNVNFFCRQQYRSITTTIDKDSNSDKDSDSDSDSESAKYSDFENILTSQFDKPDELKVAILGPSNAGKSTLFNRIMCKDSNKAYRLTSEKSLRRPKRSHGRLGNNNPSRQNAGAIVSSTPGTTRDRRECIGRIGGTTFTLVDTAGVDRDRISLLYSGKGNTDPMETKMIQQTLEAAKQSDLILLMFDAKVGITADFADIVNWLRKIKSPSNNNKNSDDHNNQWQRQVVILANKLEGDGWAGNYYSSDSHVMDHLSEVSRLGFGEAIPISAEHGEGLADIAAIIEEFTKKKKQCFGLDIDDNDLKGKSKGKDKGDKNGEKSLHLAILGRQNVGKSTLVNSLLKQDRVIAGSMPGLTRDAISVNWSWMGRPVQLVDTAGIRRMAKRDQSDEIEDLAVRDAMRAMKIADVAVLVLDAEARLLQRQELAIADAVVREGRSLVVAANKMDLLIDADYTQEDYAAAVRKQIELRFPMLRSTPVVSMSSLTGESVEDLMPVVFNARDRWAKVINTGLLNRWLRDVIEIKPPPLVQGRPLKIKYVMQVKGRPPTFLLFCNVDQIPVSYLRYLTRNFQDTFEMYGMEVRLSIKKSASENPYHDNTIKRGGSGLGGSAFRKKRLIAELKASGKPKRKGSRRRTNRARYR